MGQVAVGVIKGLSCGGFFIWALMDYFLCIYIALSKAPKIDVMGFHADFEPSTIENAFWLCILWMTLNLIKDYLCCGSVNEQRELQQQEQQKLENAVATAMAEANQAKTLTVVQTQPPTKTALDVPRHHQTLAYIPIQLTKALRKIGAVSDKPTVPELIVAFAKLDRNEDGQLDRDEIKEALTAMGANDADVGEMVRPCDKDGDGKISKEEFLLAFATPSARRWIRHSRPKV
jgi:Ca2+-binding EF-hand superfamily protein